MNKNIEHKLPMLGLALLAWFIGAFWFVIGFIVAAIFYK